MPETNQRKSIADAISDMQKADQIELELWREMHPFAAQYMREAAMAKAQGREPEFMKPIVIGSQT